MNKREFIKSSLAGLSASALALTQAGCSKNEEISKANLDNDEIIPKQTGTYEFSCPLPFNYKTIDEIVELNSTLKKSKITSLYNNIPIPLASNFDQWIQVVRGKGNPSIKTYNDFFKYVDYAHDKGFKVTYLMNSPKAFSPKNFNTFKGEFYRLLNEVKKHNIKDIKVASTQVAGLINDYAPNEFNYSASTAFEYTSMSQYENLFTIFDNFTLIDITSSENQNFALLKSLRKRFPDKKIEIMLNEGCVKRCPSRNECLPGAVFSCRDLKRKIGTLKLFMKLGITYPWDLEYYSAIGINNFKYTGKGHGATRCDFHNLTNMKTYLNCVENGVEDMTVKDFFVHIIPGTPSFSFKELTNGNNLDKIKLLAVKDFFPDIRYFVKHGAECAYRCEVECNYCFECAKKLENLLMNV